MLKFILSTMMISISFLMIFPKHPLIMLMLILMQTLLTCLITGLLINSYWFSYILFLTFLGGLLVLFIYVTSIASNEMIQFYMMKYLLLFFLIIIIFITTIILINSKLYWLNFSFNYEMNNFFNKYLFFNNENKFNMMKLYNEQTFILMMMMVIYLFISLIMVIKITNIFFGPLRIFN